MRRLARKAGINKKVNVHTFRHYFGSSMISDGADITVVKELMRHSDMKITMIYVHLDQKTLKRHYDKYMSEI